MKKAVILLLAAVLLSAGCANRPENLNETEETSSAEEEYTAPPKTYMEEIAQIVGYHDLGDSVLCYSEPLIGTEDCVSAGEINWSAEEDSRFLSCHYTYTLEYTFNTTTTWYDHPNGNYLTTADGERTKLCPDEECRNDYGMLCTHLDLFSAMLDTQNAVCENWVYFIGASDCFGSPDHPYRGWTNDKVNMLLRYSITEHTIENVMFLPDSSVLRNVYRGILYITSSDSVSHTPVVIIVDGVNLKAAITEETSGVHNSIGIGDYLVTLTGTGQVIGCSAGLTQQVLLASLDSGGTLLGKAEGKLWMRSRSSDSQWKIIGMDEKYETHILDREFHANTGFAVAGEHLYTWSTDALRCVFSYDNPAYNPHNSSEKILSIYAFDDEIAACSLGNGRKNDVFYESTLPEGEYITGADAFGDYLRIETTKEPDHEVSGYPILTYYIWKNGKIIPDGTGYVYHTHRFNP